MKISEKKCTKCLKTLPADKFGLMKDTYTTKRQALPRLSTISTLGAKLVLDNSHVSGTAITRSICSIRLGSGRVIKKIVYTHYGNICSCCGESDYMFLTIDHINNDGHKQRRKISTQLYKSIIDDGFPRRLTTTLL